CTRSKPGCEACPVNDGCRAYARDEIRLYPGSKPKKEKPEKTTWMLILEDAEGRILLERRPPSGIWGGLWSLPELDPAYGADELPQPGTHQRFSPHLQPLSSAHTTGTPALGRQHPGWRFRPLALAAQG